MNKQLFFYSFGLAVVCTSLFSACNSTGSSTEIVTTENGIQYIHHIQKNGTKPQAGNYAFFQLEVFVDDSLLHSSRKVKDNPLIKIPTKEQGKQSPNPVVDVLSYMSVGDSVTIIESLDSMPHRPPGFEKYDNLTYNVVLVDVKSEEEYKVFSEEKQKIQKEKALVVKARLPKITEFCNQVLIDHNLGKLTDKFIETTSGIRYIIHEEGTGEIPVAGESITVHYYGTLMDGTEFDASFNRGVPLVFAVGQGRVIEGWEEGLTLLKRGTKATLFIPSQLAYKEAGNPPVIPPKSDLVFYVELLDVE